MEVLRLSCLLIALGMPAQAELYVHDGDTVYVNSQPYRLTQPACHLSFDAPEAGTPAGSRATAYLRAWVAQSRTYSLHDTGQRNRGRIIAVMHLDGVEVGQHMIDAGYARPLQNWGWC